MQNTAVILSLRLILYFWLHKRIFMVSLAVFVLPAAACYLTAWWNINTWFLMEMLSSSFDYHRVKGHLQERNLTKAKARYVGAFSVVALLWYKTIKIYASFFFFFIWSLLKALTASYNCSYWNSSSTSITVLRYINNLLLLGINLCFFLLLWN